MSTSLQQARTLAGRSKRALLGIAGARRAMRCPPFDVRLHRQFIRDEDYTRLAAFAAALHRLDTESVSGSIAEVGVFQGATSVILQQAAPARTLHLFDTFTGFPQEQLDLPGKDDRFRETSEDRVRRRFAADAPVKLHAGVVPETLVEVASESFAFVLLDLDLSEPTRQALEFFWPRMTPGSYLFVHDYHNAESQWAAQRVLGDFLADKPDQLIDLPDIWGSVVLRRTSDSVSASQEEFSEALRAPSV